MSAQDRQRVARGGLALFAIRQQHRVALVAHDTPIVEGATSDSPRQGDGFRRRVGATPMHAGVDLDDYIEGTTCARTTELEFTDVEFAFYGSNQLDLCGDREQAIDFSCTCDLVGYEDRPKSGPREYLRLTEFCGGNSDGPCGELTAGDLGCLGRLEMWTQLLGAIAKIGRHRSNVVLDQVQVEDQCGRVDIGFAHVPRIFLRGASAARVPVRAPRARP